MTSTGWETFLQGIIDSRLQITGTWPARTENASRMRGHDSNALASCIVLVCRPRPNDAITITRRQFLVELGQELQPALATLTQGNIAPVDLAQAAIGPGMAVFSRYAAVLEPNGSPMRVRSALSLINQEIDRSFEAQEGWYDPQTRWAVAWFATRGFSDGPYGEAEVLAVAKDSPVPTLVSAGIVRSGGGKVRLLKRDEMREAYDPAEDESVTVWQAAQHLAYALDSGGELAAARLVRRFRTCRPELDVERARDLAYRLFALCEQKRWPQEARAYNALVLSWSDIETVSQTDEAEWLAPSAERTLFTED